MLNSVSKLSTMTAQVVRNLVRKSSNALNYKVSKTANSESVAKNFIRRGSNAPPGSWWEKGGNPADSVPFRIDNINRTTAIISIFFGSGFVASFWLFRYLLVKKL